MSSQTLIFSQEPSVENEKLSNILFKVAESGKYKQCRRQLGIPYANARCAIGAIMSEMFGWSPEEDRFADIGDNDALRELNTIYGELTINRIMNQNDELDMSYRDIANDLRRNGL